MAILKTIRPLNILIIILFMWGMRYWLITPILASINIYPYLNNFHYWLLVLSVASIAAAGYIINDCCDVDIDRINRPLRNQIDLNMSMQQAQLIYYILNICSFLIAIYISFKCNSLKLASIHLLSAGLLWLYANSLKRKLIVGNASVAILSAMVIFIPIVYEPIIFYNPNPSFARALNYILINGLLLSTFAFVVSFAREIVKDIEDMKGDINYGCNSIPIVFGVMVAKWIVAVLLIVVASMLLTTIMYYKQVFFIIYISSQVALITIMVYLLFKMPSSNIKSISKISALLKLLMITGFSSILFSFKYFVTL